MVIFAKYRCSVCIISTTILSKISSGEEMAGWLSAKLKRELP